MGDVAIRVENLGKLYRIGVGPRHDTLRDALAGFGRKNLQSAIQNPKSEEFWALRDVSFEVKCGEVVGVIGRNGAGKSTLLKILSRITEPTDGYAEIHGRVGSLLEVGTGFHPELTGRENIYLNGAILGMKRTEIDRKFDEIVAFSEIEKFLDTPVKRYSSGMYVRLAFAVAAHLEPEILLVDEVLAVGDVAFQKKCLGKMGEVAKEGRTVLFVSHNMGAVSTLCDRALWINQGNLWLDSEAQLTISRYLNAGKEDIYAKCWGSDSAGPGNDSIRLESVRLVGEDLQPIQVVTSDSPLTIAATCHLYKPFPSTVIGISIYSEQGFELFNSHNDDSEGAWSSTWKPGRYTFYCEIPSFVLNEGRYYVNVAAERNSEICFVEEQALCFSIDFTDKDGDYRQRGGFFRMRLAWSFFCHAEG